ncbi:hypothetical protein HNP86_001867 [Methanococcus maripaludis]|uniref:Concanavalin A-like lectin/glucanase superfamily protein n=1 Tax=Methanococcus maripaludis TaxID=39152 RepID=A0A7J9NVK7_METMI|nr:LamG-like jellyroll fold domain-containing protein [Methanococcus maripaludis]MBA2851708.1 hypothetical protein [Methanococcus maripaludis]
MKTGYIKLIDSNGSERLVRNIVFGNGFDVNHDKHGANVTNINFSGGLDYEIAKNIYDLTDYVWRINPLSDIYSSGLIYAVYNGSAYTDVDISLTVNTVIPMSKHLLHSKLNDMFVIDANGTIYDWYYDGNEYFGEITIGIKAEMDLGEVKNFYVIFGNPDNIVTAFRASGAITYVLNDDVLPTNKLNIYPAKAPNVKLPWKTMYGKLYVDTSTLDINDVVIVESTNGYAANDDVNAEIAGLGVFVQKRAPYTTQTVDVVSKLITTPGDDLKYFIKFDITPDTTVSGPVCIILDTTDYVTSGMMKADGSDIVVALVDSNDDVITNCSCYVEPDTVGTVSTRIWIDLDTSEPVTCMVKFGNTNFDVIGNTSIFDMCDDFTPNLQLLPCTVEKIDDNAYKVTVSNDNLFDIEDAIIKVDDVVGDAFDILTDYDPEMFIERVPYTYSDSVWFKADIYKELTNTFFITNEVDTVAPTAYMNVFMVDKNIINDGLLSRFTINCEDKNYTAYNGVSVNYNDYGNSFVFTGTSYVEMDFENKNEHTFSMDVKLNAMDDFKPIMSCGDGANNVLNVVYLYKRIYAMLYDGLRTVYVMSNYVYLGEKNQVTVRYKKGGFIELIVNGVSCGTTSDNSNVTLSNQIRLGSRYDSDAYYLNGEVSNFKVYDGLATDTTIKRFVNEPTTVITSDEYATLQFAVTPNGMADTYGFVKPSLYDVHFATDRFGRPNRAWAFNGTGYIHTGITLPEASTLIFDVYMDSNETAVVIPDVMNLNDDGNVTISYNSNIYTTPYTFETEKWYKIAITSGTSTSVYVDGSLLSCENSVALSGLLLNYIGQGFGGRLGDAYVFDRELSPSEINSVTTATKFTENELTYTLKRYVEGYVMTITCPETITEMQVDTGLTFNGENLKVCKNVPDTLTEVLEYTVENGVLYVNDILEPMDTVDYYVCMTSGYVPSVATGDVYTSMSVSMDNNDYVYTVYTVTNDNTTKDGWIRLGEVDSDSLQITRVVPPELKRNYIVTEDSVGVKLNIPVGQSKQILFDFNKLGYKCTNTPISSVKPYWITPDLQTLWTIADGNEVINVNVTEGHSPDGVSVFEDFDDSFDDLTKYTNTGLTINVADGILAATNTIGGKCYLHSNTPITLENVILEGRMKGAHTGTSYAEYIGLLEPTNTDYILFGHSDAVNSVLTKSDGTFELIDIGGTFEDDYHTYRFDMKSSTVDFYKDGVHLLEKTNHVPVSPKQLYLGIMGENDSAQYIDYWFIRKYLETPPSVSKTGNSFTIGECSIENYQIALDVSDLGLISADDSLLIESITSVIPEGVELTPTVINYGDGTFKVILTNDTGSDIDGNVYINSSVFGVVTENTSIKITDVI